MKLFDSEYFQKLIGQAKNNSRGRQHCNIHQSYEDPCQRLFNAIEPGSYIQPHRHATDAREELLVAVRGKMAVFTFDDSGIVTGMFPLVAGLGDFANSVGVEVSSHVWHTVISLETGSILLEVKAGPFDPSQPKDLAPWAPEEGTLPAINFLARLVELSKAIRISS
jgi:cupin fold WbuC family metalloprotein